MADRGAMSKVRAPAKAKPAARSALHPSAGRLIAPELRARMESRLRWNFADVRLHDDSEAAARAGAAAFTIGRTIAFAPNAPARATRRGEALLQHELAHVAQQDHGRLATIPLAGETALEAEATAASRSRTSIGVTGAAPAMVQRMTPEEEDAAARFDDPELSRIVGETNDSPFGDRLSSDLAAHANQPPLPVDPKRSASQVDHLAHTRARDNPPPGEVDGGQIQHWFKTLDVTSKLPSGLRPLAADIINRNLSWLQSKKDGRATELLTVPDREVAEGKHAGTRYYAGERPQGGRQDSWNLLSRRFRTEHKFSDAFLIPSIRKRLTQAHTDTGLAPPDPYGLAISAGEEARWRLTGDSGTEMGGRMIGRPTSTPEELEASRRVNEEHLPGARARARQMTEQFLRQKTLQERLERIRSHRERMRRQGGFVELPSILGRDRGARGSRGQTPAANTPAPQRETAPPAQEHEGPAQEAGRGRPSPGRIDPRSRGQRAADAGIHGLNTAATALRTYDAYQQARDSGEGVAPAALSAGQAYLANTNPLVGGLASYQAKQAEGQDSIEAALSAGGETVAGMLYGGSRLDQAVNAVANATGAVDDHLHHEKGHAGPQARVRAIPAVTETAAELTPSRMAMHTAGSGLRAGYVLTRAAQGDMKPTDRFGKDAVTGKIGMAFQPAAMVASFAGNLGRGEGAGKAFDRTLQEASGSTLAVAGNAVGDAAWAVHEKVAEVIDQDLPKFKASVAEQAKVLKTKANATAQSAWASLKTHLPW